MKGEFYGIGVGPGSPDLLTIRATQVLQLVDVVCVPRSSAEKEVVALKIAGAYIPQTTEIIEISTPMTRDKTVLQAEWQRGAEKIAAFLNEGKRVAFITIGDAMLFSTYTYLLKRVQALAPEAAVESIPGVTSFAASAAHLNVALAEGNERLAIIPAVDDPAQLRPVFDHFSNAVLMKVAGKYDEILDILEEKGLQDKAVYVSKLGYPEQFVTYDLESLRGKDKDYLSLILVKREGF
jgi:precorrin-2/cobalt-factor-2 C20-methyltransferase